MPVHEPPAEGHRILFGVALAMAMCTAIACIGFASASSAACLALSPTCLPFPQLEYQMDARVSPGALPERTFAPAGVHLRGRIANRDGSHPQALREMVLEVDKDVGVDFRGLPVCEVGGRQDRKSLDEVKRECRKAIVGSGEATLMLSFSGQAPIRASTRLAVFNMGRQSGVRTLAVVGFIAIPVPALIATEVKLHRRGRGWRAVAKIPRVSGGAGSLLTFQLKLRRTFFHRGERRSFLSARCPDRRFRFSVPKAVFKNEAKEPGVAPQTILKGSRVVPCKPKG